MVKSTKRYIPDVRNIREINLPNIPDDLLKKINFNYDEYLSKWNERDDGQSVYMLSDSFNEELNRWGKENICDSIYYEFQIIRGDTDIHRDHDPWNESPIEYNNYGLPRIKFVYLLESGGDNVKTEFFDDEQNLTDSYVMQKYIWYMLRVENWHRVIGIEPNKIRFAVVGHIF